MAQLGLSVERVRGDKGFERLVRDLENLFSFDYDHCGANGVNNLWRDAIDLGCVSNIEYLAKEFLMEYYESSVGNDVGDTNCDEILEMVWFSDLIEYVIEQVFERDSYYSKTEYHLTSTDSDENEYVVSLAYLTSN